MSSPKLERDRRRTAFRMLMIRERIPGGAIVVDLQTRDEILQIWNFAMSEAELLLFGERADED